MKNCSSGSVFVFRTTLHSLNSILFQYSRSCSPLTMSKAITELQLRTVIGFNGKFANSLIYTRDQNYLIYSLGLTVVVKNLRQNTQAFLHGHTDLISCLTLSHDETKLASGQESKSRGKKVPVLIWDLDFVKSNMESKSDQSEAVLHTLSLHMGKVQDVCFSAHDTLVYTLGGQDDNSLVCWDVASGEPLCGTSAGEDSTLVLQSFNCVDELLVSGGNYAVTLWRVDRRSRKFHSLKANLGNLKRIVTCVAISPDDATAYCGSKTGDVMEISLECDLTSEQCNFPPVGTQKPRYSRSSKERFSQGIQCLKLVAHAHKLKLMVGAGDGSFAVLQTTCGSVSTRGGHAHGQSQKPMATETCEKLTGAVTSISGQEGAYYIGTAHANMYGLLCDDAKPELGTPELRATCHYEGINDVIFPKNPSKDPRVNSELFLSCSKNDIRIWNAAKMQEILRIQVPNLTCHCIDITEGGDTILSGWDDGKIRAFFPESGKLKYIIHDAHTESVTALAVCSPEGYDRREYRLLSGGKDGRVRVWRITASRQSMEASMKEHRGTVNSIQITKDHAACVSASADGSCIVWNLETYARAQAMFASTVFRKIMYHPDESQMISCGSDRRVTYFDAYDGEAIRFLEEAADGEMLALDIEPTGTIFVSGGQDSILKVWHYDNGEPIAVGKGHSGDINAAKITPDCQSIITTGSEGAIMIWDMGNTMEVPETSA